MNEFRERVRQGSFISVLTATLVTGLYLFVLPGALVSWILTELGLQQIAAYFYGAGLLLYSLSMAYVLHLKGELWKVVTIGFMVAITIFLCASLPTISQLIGGVFASVLK